MFSDGGKRKHESVTVGFIMSQDLKRTRHVTLRFPTLDPLSSLVPPVVLIGQDHVHVDVVVDGRIQNADVEAQEGEHPPGRTHGEKRGE